MKKIMILVLLALASFGMTQGWTHTVQPVFDAPFNDLLLPWAAEGVRLVDIHECWPNEEPPFLGTEWRFWCYEVPGTDAWSAAQAIEVAARDQGYSSILYGSVTVGASAGEGRYWAVERDGPTFRYHPFNADGRVLISMASNAP